MQVNSRVHGQCILWLVALGLTSSWKMSWHYFGTRHEKGEWDGAGASAIVKRALKAKQFHNLQRRLHDAFDVVQFF